MLEEKVRPYIQNIDNGVLSQPIIVQSQNQIDKVFFFVIVLYSLLSIIMIFNYNSFIMIMHYIWLQCIWFLLI